MRGNEIESVPSNLVYRDETIPPQRISHDGNIELDNCRAAGGGVILYASGDITVENFTGYAENRTGLVLVAGGRIRVYGVEIEYKGDGVKKHSHLKIAGAAGGYVRKVISKDWPGNCLLIEPLRDPGTGEALTTITGLDIRWIFPVRSKGIWLLNVDQCRVHCVFSWRSNYEIRPDHELGQKYPAIRDEISEKDAQGRFLPGNTQFRRPIICL